MKALTKAVAIATFLMAGATTASAQYYELANQATNILSTILQGGSNYRGYAEVTYLNGIGSKKASFVELSTTHGFTRGNKFFMGVGLGVDYMFTSSNNGSYLPSGNRYTTNAFMIPLYTDFRLNLGKKTATSFFIDLKIGAGFYVSDKFIQVGDGYVNSSESFLLRPSIGFRFPLSSKETSKTAINVGASYQLLTNSYWYNPYGSNGITLNSLGANISIEW